MTAQTGDIGSTAYRWILAAILAAALAIRCANIDFGLPAQYHPDEARKARIIELILAGEPHTYLNHPGLLLNSVALVCAALRRLGLPLDGESIILAGRILVAFVGGLTVLPTAALARTLFDRGAGLFAAAALAFSPIHTVHSRYLKEDVYLTFGVVVALWGLARWLRAPAVERATRGGRRWLLVALGGAGLAMASKYVGAAMVLFVVEAWRRASGASWRRALAWTAAAAVLAALATPQLLTGLRQGRSGLYSLFWELEHGILGGQSSTNLFVFEWPDLGFYFLFNGLGWGLSWPLALLATAAIAVAIRRRARDPVLAWTAAAAILWYAVAELTPLKRGADVERYVLPCVPLWAAVAAGWVSQWRPLPQPGTGLARDRPRRVAAALAPALLLLPLAHSLALAVGIGKDTRRLAARWLAENGPSPPYQVAYLGPPAYQLEGALLERVTMKRVWIPFRHDQDRDQLERSAVLTVSELENRRHQAFPLRSGKQTAARDRMRADFPVAVVIRKPFYLKAGFHNPDIELRQRATD